MSRRQTGPTRWLILDSAAEVDVRKLLCGLPHGTGVLVINPPAPNELLKLRRSARSRDLSLVTEHRRIARRVHDIGELRSALLARVQLIFLSPIYRTATHSDWRAIPRMRAAAMTRLAGRNILALGGMDERRFRHVRPLGFLGWAGVSAWKRPKS